MKKRARSEARPEVSAAAPVDSGSESGDSEAVAEALAAGIIGRGPKRAASVNNKPALRAALASFQADLPWVERLEVVSAEPLAVDGVADDLKLELALCVRGLCVTPRAVAIDT